MGVNRIGITEIILCPPFHKTASKIDTADSIIVEAVLSRKSKNFGFLCRQGEVNLMKVASTFVIHWTLVIHVYFRSRSHHTFRTSIITLPRDEM